VSHDPRAAAYADSAVFLGDGHISRWGSNIDVDDMAKRLRVIMETVEKLQVWAR